MNILHFFAQFGFFAAIISCTDPGTENNGSGKLSSPTGLIIEQTTDTSAKLSWTADKDARGYYVFCKASESTYYVDPAATLPASSSDYTFEGLEQGYYSFGVQARADNAADNSEIAWTSPMRIINYSKAPDANIDDLSYNHAFLRVKYSFKRVSDTPEEYGICIGGSKLPTIDDVVFHGPVLKNLAAEHIISSAVLEYGKEYHVRAFVKAEGEYWYSQEYIFTMKDDTQKIDLEWKKLSFDALPSSIEVYETTSALNGRKFHAWYAVADCTGDVEFRVLNPSSKATLEKQAEAEGNCYVMINGGIFGTKHIGVIYSKGEKQAWRNEVDGNYWGYDEKLYNITRAIIGTDASGKPSAFWTSAPDESHVFFYDRPMTTVMGGSLWPAADENNPGPAQAWNPVNAISTGPMVLYNGKNLAIPVKNDAGYYVSNYECWAEDIFPTKPDRTAVGFTEDGKIVLFICDGRIADSDGAYIHELGAIMKSIGCISAMNLDGGGSTAMIVNGVRLNSLLTGHGTATENRPVLSTLGFFKKK